MVETRGGRRFAAFFFVAAFLVLLFGRWLEPVDHVALSISAPFAAAIGGIANATGDVLSGVFEGPRLRAENNAYRHQINTLLKENITLRQAGHENKILRRMLRFDDANSHMDLLTARVIGSDPNHLTPYILIDRGTRDGLRKGMTVVDQDGFFVGSIADLSFNAGKVLPMVSPSSSVGALDLRTRAAGLVEGRFSGGPVFRWVVASASMRTGDFVVTSGQMNLYPRNLLLGQIIRVRHRNDALFQTAQLQPAANFQNLEMVQVVRNFVPSVPVRLVSGP